MVNRIKRISGYAYHLQILVLLKTFYNLDQLHIGFIVAIY